MRSSKAARRHESEKFQVGISSPSRAWTVAKSEGWPVCALLSCVGERAALNGVLSGFVGCVLLKVLIVLEVLAGALAGGRSAICGLVADGSAERAATGAGVAPAAPAGAGGADPAAGGTGGNV